MRAIFEREVNSYFNGIHGYLLGAFMLLFAGIFTMVVNLSQNIANFEYVMQNMDIILLIIIPILSMKSIAEDRRNKTNMLLYSLPMSMTKIVLGKYFAMILVLVLPTTIICVYPLILSMYGPVSLKIAYISIMAFFLLCCALVSIGLFISSTTESQGISAGICFIALLIIYLSASLADYISSNPFTSFTAFVLIIAILGIILNFLTKNSVFSFITATICECILLLIYWISPSNFAGLLPAVINEISVFERFYIFTYGIFDITSLVYLISVSVIFIFLTVQSMEKRRWN